MPKKSVKYVAPKPVHPLREPLHPAVGTLAFVHSLGVVVYVAIVAQFIQHGDELFGDMKSIWGPIAFLLLFTLSAAIVGLLVFGRPIYLYLEGKKREAFSFTFATLGFLFVEVLFVFIILMLMNV